MSPTVTVLSNADWHTPLWTNKQHLARQLAAAFPVTYVESLGVRRPELSVADVVRVARRVRRFVAPDRAPRPDAATDAVTVVSPAVIPIHTGPTQTLNRALLQRQRPWRTPSDVLWTFTPVTYGLEQRSAASVYHCTDLLAEFPRIDRDAVDDGERRLALAGALAIASSAPVAEHLHRQGFAKVLRWDNVGDTETFERHVRHDLPCHRRPSVIFAGNLTDHKIDGPLLVSLAAALRDRAIPLLLAGPIADGGGTFAIADELRMLGADFLGCLTPDALAAACATATVGIIPYAHNRYTAGVNPLKTFEYLASGLACVSTRLPALTAHSPDVTLVDDHQRFVETVLDAVAVPDPATVARRQAIARDHSWTGRGQQARDLVTSLAYANEPALSAS
jgi:teichuronic acid biosynthesis glycosyltransferase TuaH